MCVCVCARRSFFDDWVAHLLFSPCLMMIFTSERKTNWISSLLSQFSLFVINRRVKSRQTRFNFQFVGRGRKSPQRKKCILWLSDMANKTEGGTVFSLCPWEGPWETLKQMQEECHSVRLDERMCVFYWLHFGFLFLKAQRKPKRCPRILY